MDSDYDDDLDDTAFLEAATQAEKDDSPPFQASPRPLKRRKIAQADDRTASIPPKRKQNQRRRPFEDSSDDEEGSDQAFKPAVATAGRRASTGFDEETPSDSTKQRRRGKSRAKDEAGDGSCSPTKKSLMYKKDRIHVPTAFVDLTDIFQTQPSREDSPPWRPRGAIWSKSALPIGVHRPASALNSTRTMTLPDKQSISSRPASRASKTPVESVFSKAEPSPTLPTEANASVDYDPAGELADLPSDAFASSSSSPQKHDGDVVLMSERRTRVMAPQAGLRQTTLFGRGEANGQVAPSQVNKRYSFIVDQKEEPPTHHKLDLEAAKTWVYPTNLGVTRDYQYNIVARGLFHNLLVALPTGLGKTFIAATIMLNWFRWTTEAQIVFVAPTKPLVSQQIDACFHIAGIPRSATTMLIGGVPPAIRAEEWKSKRVFFMTPQTLLNDLKSGYADPKRIVLLVVDEAHRATGSYAYVEVVSFLRRFNQSFRVLALTATPGADVEAVQKVIDGLDISKIEIRTESSLDIRSYIHQRTIEKHAFTNSDEMEMCMDLYSQALQPLVNKIAGVNAYYSTNPLDLTPYGCTQARQKWFAQAGKNASQGQKAMVNSIFSILASVSQGMELLKYHGIGPFYTKMKDFKDSQAESKSKYKKEICDSDSFKKLMVRLHTWVTSDTFIGHPKLEFLQQVILDHFVNAGEGRNADGAPPSQTRIMVFAHFRDSAEEIVRVLKRHQPMIRPRVFVGQSHAKNSDGMGQREQLEAINQFKLGTFNTLVATSIGEEGLDIGEVDLIICYDSKASPIRMLQRMGRTGRKRRGKIVMLQMKGKEESDATKAKDGYEKMQELIAEGSRFAFHDEVSRRILPRDVQPVVDKRFVDIPPENSQSDWLPEPKKKNGRVPKRPPKKFHMPDGAITGFVTAGRMDEEIAPKARAKKKAAPMYPNEESVDPAAIESVLLDDAAIKDLERRYQTVYDEDDAPIIPDLRENTHPARQRVLSKTTYFRQPGRVAQAFVATLQRMHAMDDDRIAEFRRNLHYSDVESDPENNIVVSGSELAVEEHMWADDDPASQPLPKPKAKPRPKPKAKTTPKAAAPRGRPRKDAAAAATPLRQTKAKAKTPRTKTPTYRMSALVDEADPSSPPPTDPRMRFASQADTIGSDDTVGADDPQNTQAYLLDSDLMSFIVGDDEEDDMPPSSLPSLDFTGLGKGTQAVVKGGRPKRPKKAEKMFTSDPTDDDAVVSSDSDDEMPMNKVGGASKSRGVLLAVGPASEEDDEPVVPRKRARRVVVDDEEDDDE
ncbi:hypothetical protein BDV95DRAFT_608976 [Massariosphaeria phaeospora]|uniref:ATP-dependent DNA helicase n=1 Tax=Massariosphaeria phaeospora TaxID=100035 RepID=A0A7C8IAR9_9PLEO|nr:hypothetical protein BDV95DRAFT_608976 [Massariosphaeria phaeospora]